MLSRILFGIRHIQIPVDVLHVERSKAFGDCAIQKRVATIFFVATKIGGLEVCVVNLDAPSKNYGEMEEEWSPRRHLCDGRALINGTGGSRGVRRVVHHHECVIGEVGTNSRAPGYDGSIFCYEGEN